MIDPSNIASAYLELWNDPEEASRRERLIDGWTADASYVDPLMAGEGYEGIAAMISGARAIFPGHTFSLRGTPNGHGRFVRFSWTLAPSDGASAAAGTDIVRLDNSGRIAEVTGFLDGGTG